MERLLNILTNPDKRHIWILNRKYGPLKEMTDGKAEVLYSYDPVAQETPFSLEAIMNIEQYNYKTFIQAYKAERKELLDDDVQDMRILAVWSFYKNVHKDDLMLLERRKNRRKEKVWNEKPGKLNILPRKNNSYQQMVCRTKLLLSENLT